MKPQDIWSPSQERVNASLMYRWMKELESKYKCSFNSYQDLHRWSCEDIDRCWREVAQGVSFPWITEPSTYFVPGNSLSPVDSIVTASWCPGGALNYAQAVLYPSGRSELDIAVVAVSESGAVETVSYGELRNRVSTMAWKLEGRGIRPESRVAAVVPNNLGALVAYLATVKLGGVWSSCSPEFGAPALLSRFAQIEPAVLITTQRSCYAGKWHDHGEQVASLVRGLPSIQAHLSQEHFSSIDGGEPCDDFIATTFQHPLTVLYSSGTTGAPKPIVHGVGGTLIQHMKEHQLHSDLRPGDVLLFYTSCAWMMWQWLVSALASGVTVVLYDGSPLHPTPDVLWSLVENHGVTHLGVSPRYLAELERRGYEPINHHNLRTLKTIFSTGAPLLKYQFEWVYKNVSDDIALQSISGGTDIISCFVLGNPLDPVCAGELQGAGLGMAIAAFNDSGASVIETSGELVCTKPFPSMPLGFWGDSDGSRYKKAYFEQFPGVWAHGDHVMIHGHGGVTILGRSDATLNPGGVRIGSAEIYSALGDHPKIAEALAVGYQSGSDESIVLFVVLRDGETWDLNSDVQSLRRHLRESRSPRHVPSHIFVVSQLPRTVNGKLSEIAVRDILRGREVTNTSALVNSEVLAEFHAVRTELEPVGLSIVIPALNEALRLPATLLSYRTSLLQMSQFGALQEILVVDDGSTDETSALALSLSSARVPIRVIKHPENRGKGAALRTGVAAARGDLMLLADADGSTPLDELPKLHRAIQSGAAIAIGSRVLRDDGSVLQAKWYRRLLGAVFRSLVWLIALRDLPNINVKDTQCGFKLLTRKVADVVFPTLRIDGFAIDVELLRAAALRGFKVQEVPVSWHHVTGSRINLVTAPVAMVRELVRIRLSSAGLFVTRAD